MSARVVITVSREDLKCILIAAVESASCGIGYWAEVKQYDHVRGTAVIREHNDEEAPKKRGPWVKVNCKTIARGLQLCSEMSNNEGGWAFTEWLRDRTGDANTADNIVQFGVLGELKYG